MIALILFVLGILASPFKAKSRLEAENAQQSSNDAHEHPTEEKISDHVCVSSMAGEGEQVATIMHEFMDIHAGDERRRSLLRTHKINRQ